MNKIEEYKRNMKAALYLIAFAVGTFFMMVRVFERLF